MESIMRRLYILIPTLAIAGALASACKPAQTESVFKSITGTNLREQIGASRKPTVVNLWATWCEPCRKEMPELVRFQKSAAGANVALYLVAAHDSKEDETAAQFLRELNLGSDQNYFYRIGEDAEKFGKTLAPTWSATLPTMFIFDAKGALKAFWVGETNQKELAERLKRALAAPVPDPALQRHAK